MTTVTGCHLIPKPVELGQSKVKAVPAKAPKTVEAEKQAAEFVARKTGEARDAALATHASTNVVVPLTDARDAALGLRYSLGAPATPWDDSGAVLAQRLGRLENKLDRALDEYRTGTAPLVGKKIEGTGIVSVPYFLWVALVIGFFFLLWTGLKVAGVLYPPVGVGVEGLSAVGRLSAATVRKGFEQAVAGGEQFKEALEKSEIPSEIRASVLDLFRRHQMVSQDRDVQEVVKSLTR